jgi:hypothetical protein
MESNMSESGEPMEIDISEMPDVLESAPLGQTAAVESTEPRRPAHAVISIFILFHLIAITCWTIPSQLAPVRVVRELVRPYLLWTGLFQSWDTFAPNPRPINADIKALVITQDHHMHVWVFPRMQDLSLSERYRKERYRKFEEVLPSTPALWPDVARHLAQSFDHPVDPTDKVMLIRFQSLIRHDQTSDAEPKSDIFYDDYVQPEDVK